MSAALQWIVSGDTGISSKAIWAQMMGQSVYGGFGGPRHSYPRDPDDFGRCYRVLHQCGWSGRMGEMAQHGPEWAALVGAWPELTALWVEEIGPSPFKEPEYFGKRAPKLYARMQELFAAAEGAR